MPHYTICSNLVLLPPTWAQIASSASYARMRVVNILVLIPTLSFH